MQGAAKGHAPATCSAARAGAQHAWHELNRPCKALPDAASPRSSHPPCRLQRPGVHPAAAVWRSAPLSARRCPQPTPRGRRRRADWTGGGASGGAAGAAHVPQRSRPWVLTVFKSSVQVTEKEGQKSGRASYCLVSLPAWPQALGRCNRAHCRRSCLRLLSCWWARCLLSSLQRYERAGDT